VNVGTSDGSLPIPGFSVERNLNVNVELRLRLNGIFPVGYPCGLRRIIPSAFIGGFYGSLERLRSVPCRWVRQVCQKIVRDG
jgi:hypothetical protein